MQKKAARRGQRALAFLLCLLMVATLLPVMGASAAKGDVSATGVELNKTLTLESNGTYTIKLEAFATGTVKTEEKTAGVPCDIVLVLDQSGSMDDDFNGNDTNVSAKKRITALKTAATTFVTQVQKNADQYNVDHKVAIVGFASGTNHESSSEGKNTELLSTKEPVSYSDIETANYQDALVSANSSGEVNERLTTAINRVDANGATYGNYGLMMAKGILDNRTVLTYTKPNGDTANRKTIVVFFTDGYPGRYATNNRFYNGKWKNGWDESSYNNITVANSTIDAAAKLKQAGATVYSVGIFSGAAPADDYNFSIESRNDNKCTYYDTGTKAANAYMHFVSSDYDSSCTSMTNSARSSIVNNGYYLAASNANDLNKVFETISDNIDSSSTSCTLDADSVLKDIISGNLDLPEGFNAAENVFVKTADYNGGAKAAESITFTDFDDKNAAPLNNAKVDVSYKTVDVSGFDYKSNYVTGVANTDGTFSGKKLIVTITGLIPNKAGMKMPSTEQGERKSGIYDDDVLKAPVDSPVFDVASRNVVIDFGMTANIANVAGVQGNKRVSTHDYGNFTYGENNLTYKLNTSVENGRLVFDGIDSALYFGHAYGDNTATNAWTKVNVIPANNVYFDDDLLNEQSDFNDGNYGYDVNVPPTTNTTSVQPENGENMAVRTFTFTGSRIDLYCTTADDTRTVTAAIYKASEYEANPNSEPIRMMAMNNRYQSGTLYNVPTLSFDMEARDTYTVVLYAGANANYQLDGIRVYNPGSADVDAMYEAGEQHATFLKVRDLLLNAGSLGTVEGTPGVVYVDTLNGSGNNQANIDDYTKVGPKNEVYLDNGNAIAFKVDYKDGMKVMVGLSAPETGNGTVKLSSDAGVTPAEINSTVDMYYAVTPTADGYVVIENTSNALISVTNVKLSGTANANGASTLSVDEGLLAYMASFDTLEVTEPTPVDPEPSPDTPAQNNTISAIIHAIWAQVKTSIDRLFGRL